MTDKECIEFAGNVPSDPPQQRAEHMLDLIRRAHGMIDNLDMALVLGVHSLTDEHRHELRMLKNEIGFILEDKEI